jgi:hypothetical protein
MDALEDEDSYLQPLPQHHGNTPKRGGYQYDDEAPPKKSKY